MEKQAKIKMENITFCIPVRVESRYRIQNLISVLKYLDKYIETNYLILEADKTQLFNNDMDIRNMKYVFVKDDDMIFHRTKYINQMLSLTKTPYAAIWDTDVILPIEQIHKAYVSLHDNTDTLIYPYSGEFLCLNELISALFSKTIDIRYVKSQGTTKHLIHGSYSVGGAFMVNVRKYLNAGGENEKFYGWGPEDVERNARVQILELGVGRINGPLYHLFHTTGINSWYANQEIEMKNKKEFCDVCGMTTSELREYVKLMVNY